MTSSQDPFFDDPLDEYSPKPSFPFDDSSEDDWSGDDFECPVCALSVSKHTIKELVDCAVMEVKYPRNWELKEADKH